MSGELNQTISSTDIRWPAKRDLRDKRDLLQKVKMMMDDGMQDGEWSWVIRWVGDKVGGEVGAGLGK